MLESGKTGSNVYGLDPVQKRMYKIIPTWDKDDIVIFSAGQLYTISYPSKTTTAVSILDRNFMPSQIASFERHINVAALVNLSDRLLFNDQGLNVSSYIYGTKYLINSDLTGHLLSSPSGNVVLANNEYIYHYQKGIFTKVRTVKHDRKKKKISSKEIPMKLVYLDYDANGSIGVGFTDSDKHIRQLDIVDIDGKPTNLDIICEPNDRILDIYADDYTDKLLLATYNAIYFHQLSGHGIQVSMQQPLKQKSDFGQIISALTADDKGNVYLCSEGSGLFQYDSIANKVKTLVDDRKHFTGNLKLYYDNLDNKLWSVGYNSAYASNLHSYDLDTKKVNKYPLDFSANDFIKEDEEHILLVGILNIKKANGKFDKYPRVARFNLQNQRLEYIPLLDSTAYISPRNLFAYKDYMLIGTKEGLVISDRAMTKILKVLDEESTKKNVALQASWIVFVKPFHNWLMVGTNGDGAFLMDPITLECLHKINNEDGLSDNVAVSMEIDPYGNAWLTSFNGINVIDSNLNVTRTIYEHDGLSHREFSAMANVTSNGSFYFGSNNGVSIIDPLAYFNRKSSKGLVIKDIEVIDKNSGITKHIGYESNIKIDNESTEIIMNFTFPDFFDYKIGNSALELSLNEGHNYTIRHDQIILSENKIGIYPIEITNTQNAKKKQVTLDIQNDYPWILISITIGIMILSYFISRFFIKRNRAQEVEKTQYNKKIAELKLNALKAQMNPHFIFNSLGAIQYFIQTQDTGKADEYLSKFAKLMRLILESSKREYINIKDEMELMELYADLEYVRFEGLFDYVVDIDDDVDTDLSLPPMIVQPLVENAINHGLYNLKGRKGLLEIFTTSPSHDKIKIVIRDNGVGRAFRSQSKKPNHKSRGMEILRERISIINSHNEMHVDLQVNDRDQIGNENGTEVVIDIKYF